MLRIGTQIIKELRIGTQKIKEAWVGSTKVFSSVVRRYLVNNGAYIVNPASSQNASFDGGNLYIRHTSSKGGYVYYNLTDFNAGDRLTVVVSSYTAGFGGGNAQIGLRNSSDFSPVILAEIDPGFTGAITVTIPESAKKYLNISASANSAKLYVSQIYTER